MQLSSIRSYFKQRLFILGLATVQCFFIKAQGRDILSDIMNGQLNNYELVNQININTADLEFAPAVYLDSIVYVANGRADLKKNKSQAKSYFNLFISATDEQGNLTGEQPLSGALNSQYHEGPLTFSKDGLVVYFTRNNQVEGAASQRKMNLSIYRSNKINGIWSTPTEMFSAKSEFSFCHPTLSVNGDRLYFSSNLPGGYGGYDLYFIEMMSGIWSNPINLGAAVNTGDNELFPALLNDNILSFSSNRPDGNGGLDIYVAELNEGKGSASQVLPAPINSSADEMSLIISNTSGVAYFASSRSGGAGQDDIYILRPVREKELIKIDQTLVLLDSISLKRLNSVKVSITTIKGEQVSEGSSDKNGVFVAPLTEGVQYNARIRAEGFPDASVSFIAGSKKTIKLKQAPCIVLTGIAQDQENNKLMDGIEIILTSSCNNEVVKKRTDGEGRFEFCVTGGCDLLLSAEIDDYYKVNMPVGALKENLLINVNFNKEKLSIVKGPLKVGTVMALEYIYYDFNQSSIRPGSERELNELVTLMNQYPEMVIDLISHTDARGDAKANLTLSIQRASVMKDYLIQKGISPDRIETQGRGETQPRNRCKDGINCTEEEHQFNRRTEVKILKK